MPLEMHIPSCLQWNVTFCRVITNMSFFLLGCIAFVSPNDQIGFRFLRNIFVKLHTKANKFFLEAKVQGSIPFCSIQQHAPLRTRLSISREPVPNPTLAFWLTNLALCLMHSSFFNTRFLEINIEVQRNTTFRKAHNYTSEGLYACFDLLFLSSHIT